MSDARDADYRVYKTSAKLERLLMETGGEVTAEVEAVEDELAADTDVLAEAAVAMRKDADAEMVKISAERERLRQCNELQKRRKAYAATLLRRVAEEKGEDRFKVGTFSVRLQAPKPHVAETDALSPEDVGRLVVSGLGEHVFKADKRAIFAELKKGAEVPGFALEYPEERTVVVR